MTAFSIENIEAAALSSMMQLPAAMTRGAAQLSAEKFSVPAHRTIFSEMIAQWNRGFPFDLVLFTQHLDKANVLASIGGAHALTSICTHIPTGANMPYYVALIDEDYDRRQTIEILTAGLKAADAGDPEALAQTLSALSEIPLRKVRDRSFKDAIREKIDRLENGEPDSDLVSTGIKYLDTKSPLRRGDMPLISGERKSGKSILALSIAVNVARNGTPVLYFSLEDREPKVIDRLFAGVSRIPMQLHHVKRMNDDDLKRATHAAVTLSACKFQLRDDVYDLSQIIAVTRQAKAIDDIGLVVVDYAQLVRCNGMESRREEVEKVSRDLRLLAMELDVPILLICQLNKDGETRETKALEMDATAMWEIKVDDADNQSERLISVPWQRNGESGIGFKVAFFGNIARVENRASDSAETSEYD